MEQSMAVLWSYQFNTIVKTTPMVIFKTGFLTVYSSSYFGVVRNYIGLKHLWQCQLNEAWRVDTSTYQMNRPVQPVLVMFPQDSLLLQVVSDLRLYRCEFLDHTPPQWLTKTKVIVLVSHDLLNEWLVKFYFKILQSWSWPNKIWELEVLFAIIITEMYMSYKQRLHRIHGDLQCR